ncbi:LysR family substrate-binding domain-containing protein [Bradyrhizobium vignae]|uniref:LysR substrate-binding domain-containing protein n=1 Tax=Bradyrhizobium vignae TaxID=1549949 RepID=A0A2U3PUL6_9BRAD|nr:LysR family substrate-binding domain-containing protein [Bradyrhizobium vignae]SPP92816.1 protein of unknown function [Bradyrhizobium vignae]
MPGGQRAPARIEIGFEGSAVFPGVLASAIANYRETRPRTEIRLTELAILTQMNEIEEGRLDVGIVRLPADLPSRLTADAIFRDPIILAIPAAHPLTMSRSVPINQLRREKFVALRSQEDVGFNAQIADLCAEIRLDPHVTQRAGQFTTLIGLVAGGLGLGFVPSSVRNLRIPDVAYRPLDVSRHSILAMVYRRSERAEAVLTFIKELRVAAKQAADLCR